MTRIWLILVGLAAFAGAVWAVGLDPFARAEAATFHVDYEHGRDEGDGLSLATAWKHAPGDPVAKGVPARTNLRAGDEVNFAANVRYRGAIVVTQSGTAAEPIVFSGAVPGATAIIDGSDPVQRVAPCRDAEDCGGAPEWRKLVRIDAPVPLTENSALFVERGLLRPAQGPDPKDDFYRDETADMAEVDGTAMSQGRVALPHAVAARLASGGGRLALWVKPNLIVYRPILAMQGDVASFDPTGLKFYTDRPARAAAIDHVALIDRPGEYVVLPGGSTAVAMLPAGSGAVTVASGRGGFRIRGASHLVFRNLGFENMADGGQLAPGGVAIFADKNGSEGVVIENNRFRNFSMPRGQGPIILRGVSNLRITGNSIDTVSLGSGMRLGGPAAHIVIENNNIRRLGRTGIMLLGVDDATVRRNVITDIRGVHGNGLSAYLANHNVRFLENTVTDARQPATFHGEGQDATEDSNILFANNLFVATPDALGSLISWGDWTRGVTIRNNVILGGKTGLRLSAKDSGVTLADNIVSGLIVAGEQPGDWKLAGNEWTALTFQQKRDGSRLSPKFAAIGTQVARGQASSEVCAVIMRHTLPQPAPAETSHAIGAELRCP
jgi:hypothetical protein